MLGRQALAAAATAMAAFLDVVPHHEREREAASRCRCWSACREGVMALWRPENDGANSTLSFADTH